MGKTKVNPRRRPVSAADIERARVKAERDALRFVSAISLTVLRDKFGYGRVRLDRFWKEINALADSVDAGYVSIHDMEQTLLDEAGIQLKN